MKGALVLVAMLGSVHSEETFLKSVVSVHKQPEGMESEHAKDLREGASKAGENMKDGASKAGENVKDGATKVVEDSASVAKRMAEHTQDKLLGHEEGHTKVMNMGEGAYQSATAVMEATTSSNTDCEDGKWHDCYKKAGDYLDHAPPGHVHGEDDKKNNIMEQLKSDAAPVSCALGFMVIAALAVQV